MVATATLALAASVNAEPTSSSDCQADYLKVALVEDVSKPEKCEALVVFSKCLGQFPADDAKEVMLFEETSKACNDVWKKEEPPSVRATRNNLGMTVDSEKEIEFYRHRRQTVSVFKMNDKVTENVDKIAGLLQDVEDLKAQLVSSVAETAKNSQDALDAKSDELDAKSAALETKLTNGLNAASDQVDDLGDKVDKTVTDTAASIDQFKQDAAATNVALEKSLSETVDEKLKPIAGAEKAIAALKTTRYANPKIPVFRVAEWHTYNQRFWHDGNRGNAFGGVAPSQWTDGSYRADQMNNDFKYLARLYTKTQTASTFGGTVCAEMFGMTSSTNGLMCSALFRIKNTGKSTVQWKPKHTMTSFTGWGEVASISVNGNNQIGNRNCQSECRDRQDTLNIPANSAGDRVSTVIFISSSSYPSGYWRSTLLIFGDNALALPTNLEYVDDLDTVTGAWKK